MFETREKRKSGGGVDWGVVLMLCVVSCGVALCYVVAEWCRVGLLGCSQT